MSCSWRPIIDVCTPLGGMNYRVSISHDSSPIYVITYFLWRENSSLNGWIWIDDSNILASTSTLRIFEERSRKLGGEGGFDFASTENPQKRTKGFRIEREEGSGEASEIVIRYESLPFGKNHDANVSFFRYPAVGPISNREKSPQKRTVVINVENFYGPFNFRHVFLPGR